MEKYFFWFECYINGNYNDYLEIIKHFNNLKCLYNISLSKENLSFIRYNKVLNKLYNKLIDNNLKIESNKEYEKLIKKNIYIVDITSKYYFSNLKNIDNPPLVIFCFGNIDYLIKRKVYIYKENYFNKYGNDIYNYYVDSFNKSNYSYISNKLNKDINVYISDKINFNILRKDLLILSFYNKNKVNEYFLYITDCIFIPQAKYDIKIANTVDILLDQGKDIYLVPNNVLYKEAYFSNYLIQNGGIVVLSEKDIKNI